VFDSNGHPQISQDLMNVLFNILYSLYYMYSSFSHNKYNNNILITQSVHISTGFLIFQHLQFFHHYQLLTQFHHQHHHSIPFHPAMAIDHSTKHHTITSSSNPQHKPMHNQSPYISLCRV